MGLAERRAIKDFQDHHLPKLQAEIHAAAGFPVPSSYYSPGHAITFEAGTLKIDHELSNVGDTSDRIKTAIELMEKSL